MLQGHPEASALWEWMIIGIPEGGVQKCKSMTNKHNLDHGKIDNELVLVCH